MMNHARLTQAIGFGFARRMLLLGEMLDARDALACGFLMTVTEPDALNEAAADIARRLLSNAPLTIRASKLALNRLAAHCTDEAHDLLASCYGSQDSQIGINAFLNKTKPQWTGL